MRVAYCVDKNIMYYFLAQSVFLAKNEDFEGWMQILVIVIMAAVYGLGAILKASKSKKLEDKEGGQEEQKAPFDHTQDRQPHPAIAVSDQQNRVTIKTESAETKQPKPFVRKPIYVESQSMVVKEQKRVKIKESPEIQPGIDKLPAIIDETVKEFEQVQSRPMASEDISETILYETPSLDFSDSEELRRAILHYEILGKPLSLREQEKAF